MSRVNNSVTLIGRIASDIETKTVGESHLATFTIAVDRPKTKKGDIITDFIRCNAWSYTAEFIAKYFGKGRKIAVQGELNIDTREMDDGSKRSYTSVRVDTVDFADSKNGTEKSDSDSKSKKATANKRSAIAAVETNEDIPW